MSRDPFQTLGLPPRFDLDPASLQKAYLLRSAAAHPDLSPDSLDPLAQDASADLNHARQVLADPESRADALLALRGGPSRDSDRSLPDGFLAQIMDIREQLQAALAAGDQSGADRLDAWARDRRAAHIASVAARFAALAAPPDPADLKAIRRELNAWRYIERMLEQLRSAL